MGMFDSIKCSAPIGELTNVNAQTKDIADDFWEGGTMSFYWIDPSGHMWATDYTGTYDFVFDGTRYTTIRTKNKGRLFPLFITRSIEIYDCTVQADGYVDTTRCDLRVCEGRLINYKYK
jgi:hypothetical protein